MNIAIDIQPLVSVSKVRGIGTYTKGLLNALFRLDTKNRYFLFNMFVEEELGDIIKYGDNVSHHYFHMGKKACLLEHKDYAKDASDEEYEALICALYQRFIRENQIEIFFITTTLDYWCSYKREWFSGACVVAMVYDVIPLLFSDIYLTTGAAKEYYADAIEFWKSADKLLAISQSVKDDLVEYLGIDPAKIDVIYSGYDTSFAEGQYTEEEKKALYKKFGINKKYLLFPTAPDYRKNLLPTLEAFEALPGNLKSAYQFVVTGWIDDPLYYPLMKRLEEQGMQSRIKITRYVSHHELMIFYKNASLLVFPSLYEGFGLPVMEAFSCGLNAVTSNNSSLGEIAAGAAVLVDPYSVQSITEGVEKALCGFDFSVFERAKNERLKQFTWENTARAALPALTERKPAPRAQKRKLAYFAPMGTRNLFLRQSYADLMEALSLYYDVHVFCEDTAALPEGIRAHPAGAFQSYASQFEERLYHVSDEPDSMYLLPWLAAYPGTVVLHDAHIHQSAYRYFVEQKDDRQAYYGLLRRELKNAREIIAMMESGPEAADKVIRELPLTGFITAGAKKLVVNSIALRNELMEEDLGGLRLYAVPYQRAEHATADGNSQKLVYAVAGLTCIEGLYPVLCALAHPFFADGALAAALSGDITEEAVLQAAKECGFVGAITFVGPDAHNRYVETADVCVVLPSVDLRAHAGWFFELLARAKSVVSLDGSARGLADESCLSIIDYNDQAYHLRVELERLLADEKTTAYLHGNLRRFLDAKRECCRIAGFVSQPLRPVLTEALIRRIYLRDLWPRGYTEKDELAKIAVTLDYIQNGTAADVRSLMDKTYCGDVAENETETKVPT
ncbi:MAG TPA: hypothetical protein DEB31_05445 [Clostridiales bacterium]|nr:hypothetical protein [Clostridiales bacterium]